MHFHMILCEIDKVCKNMLIPLDFSDNSCYNKFSTSGDTNFSEFLESSKLNNPAKS